MNHYVSLSIAILAEVIATASMKASHGLTRPLPSVVVVVGYVTAFFFLAQTLRTLPVGIAYAIWSGAGTALIALIGVIAFRQKLDLAAIAGIALIIAGVLVLNVFSSAASH